jgi:DNA ligase (NAD+)
VSKRNLIIPYIEENLDRQECNYIPTPKKCPSCGHETWVRNTGTADFLFCPNEDCPAKLLDKFVHFCSRDAMNIEGLSEATLEKFINKGWLKTFDDIYKLSEHKNEIINMEGFGHKSYTKLVTAIENSKTVKMENFLYGLGIDQIGKSASRTISKYFKGDWWAFEKALSNGFDFTALEDFGTVTNELLHEWYNNSYLRKMWVGATMIMNFVKEEKPQSTSFKNLSGLTFCITGAVYSFKNRDELKALVESLQGKVTGSVTGKTNFLVCNEDAGSSKSQKAKELGVKVITEDEFNKMIGRNV